jgi:hypothetical protein
MAKISWHRASIKSGSGMTRNGIAAAWHRAHGVAAAWQHQHGVTSKAAAKNNNGISAAGATMAKMAAWHHQRK